MKTRNQVIAARSHGIRYFDRAAAKVGRERLIERTIEILSRFNNGIGWGLGNAVIEILDPKGDISQSYNTDEVLTSTEIERIFRECKMGDPHALVYNCWFDEQKAPACMCYPRAQEKAGEARFSDEQVVQFCLDAMANIANPKKAPVRGQSFPDKKTDSTATCKELLTLAYEGTPFAHAKWKRTSKKKAGEATVREFACKVGNTEETATVTISPEGSHVEKKSDGADIKARLIAAAAVIEHSGDYGELYWKPTTKEVWWVMSDSDDGSDFIEDTLLIPGVATVFTGCECGPYDDEEENHGWEFLGVQGKIDPNTFPAEFMKTICREPADEPDESIPPDINRRKIDDF